MNEEDIKILENYKEMNLDDFNYNERQVKQAIENLINRNKELKETLKDNWEFRDKCYIPKSKIKEKIEELNKLIIEAQKELGSASKEYTIYVYQKDILEELLEKRK